MALTFYTLDDFRLGPGLGTVDSFPAIRDAMSRYRNLPDDTPKELGLTDGQRTLRLIRRVALFPAGSIRENVLVTGQLTQPPWRGAPEVATVARKCVSSLKVRYCLDRDRLVPKPGPSPKELRQGNYGPPAVRRAYVAGLGWLSPAELERRFPREDGVFSYPLVLKYLADVQTDDGPRTMELTHWDLHRLEYQAGVTVYTTNK